MQLTAVCVMLRVFEASAHTEDNPNDFISHRIAALHRSPCAGMTLFVPRSQLLEGLSPPSALVAAIAPDSDTAAMAFRSDSSDAESPRVSVCSSSSSQSAEDPTERSGEGGEGLRSAMASAEEETAIEAVLLSLQLDAAEEVGPTDFIPFP